MKFSGWIFGLALEHFKITLLIMSLRIDGRLLARLLVKTYSESQARTCNSISHLITYMSREMVIAVSD